MSEPLVVFVLPRCPNCGSTKRLRNNGTKKRGLVRYYKCPACKHAFPAYRREQHEVRGRFCDETESPPPRKMPPGEPSSAAPQSPA